MLLQERKFTTADSKLLGYFFYANIDFDTMKTVLVYIIIQISNDQHQIELQNCSHLLQIQVHRADILFVYFTLWGHMFINIPQKFVFLYSYRILKEDENCE